MALEFTLQDSETKADVVAEKFFLRVFDLDEGGADTSEESVHARGFKDYYLTEQTSVQVSEELSDLTRFQSSRYGTVDDNPTSPVHPTLAQEAKSVGLYYEKTASVVLTLEVSPGDFCKTFLFAARACFNEECTANPCAGQRQEPVACRLGDWEDWGHCDRTCGVGQRVRARQVVTEPAFGGKACQAPLSEMARCETTPCGECIPVNCSWEQWGSWSACSHCGGEQRRFRHVAAQASCGGQACHHGAAEEVTNCTRSCTKRSMCSWDDWQPFGQCSSHCGQGLRSRTRFLKAVDETPADDAHTFAQKSLVDDEFNEEMRLQYKVEVLQMQKEKLSSTRMQALVGAFAAGCVSLAFAAAVVSRGICRQFRRPRQPPSGLVSFTSRALSQDTGYMVASTVDSQDSTPVSRSL